MIKKALIVIGFFLAIFIGVNFVAWSPLFHTDTDAIKGFTLSKKIGTVGGRYDIGEQNGHIQICDSFIRYGCLNGKLKSLYIENKNEAYIYFILNDNIDLLNTTGTGYTYKLFGMYDKKFINSKENLPKFGMISNNDIDLYSDKDLNYIDKDLAISFKELEKNLNLNINGVDYTNK